MLGGLAVFLGIVLLGDALLTVVWRDPFTTVFAQHEQKALGRELAAVERAPLSPETAARMKVLRTRERIAMLAGRLDRGTRQGHPLGRISIPRIDASMVFVAGTGSKSLKKGPGHYPRTPLPGQDGTVGVAGHRTTYLAPFRHLDRLRRDDRIVATMPYGRFSYRVEGSRVVRPSRLSVLRRASHDRLVLTTCTPLFSAARRLIVTARLQYVTARGQTVRVAAARWPHLASRRHRARSPRKATRRHRSRRS
jgi:sortase A